MKVSDFDYSLPTDLIAQKPSVVRGDSRLLNLGGTPSDITHLAFSDLPSLLYPGDLLVFNNTRVMPARLWGKKETGGKVEILVERILDQYRILAHIRSSRSSKIGVFLNLDADEDGQRTEFQLLVESERQGLFVLRVQGDVSVTEILDLIGHVPLPPYITRKDESIDVERYQTVFAKVDGAIAAPTAGLHFTEDLLKRVKESGVLIAEITLHVGSGTFQPVRVEQIDNHVMHAEKIIVDQSVCDKITETKKCGGRVVAIGTTAVRALESAALSGQIDCFAGESELFIYPGYEFKCVDALLTNFHLPRSTLLLLVSAFAGRKRILKAYQEAISMRYRFFSYGDAMFIGEPGRDTP